MLVRSDDDCTKFRSMGIPARVGRVTHNRHGGPGCAARVQSFEVCQAVGKASQAHHRGGYRTEGDQSLEGGEQPSGGRPRHEVHGVISYESPSGFGPALVYTTKSDVTMRRPDKLKVVTLGGGPVSEFYFDGKVMLAFAPAENLVAVADAPPTIDDTLEYAFHSAEIYFPFTDFIVTDPYAGLANGMQLAFYIGQSKVVGGTTTDMVAYASDDLFAQIWIGAEDKLPRRIRAVYRRDPLQLRHEMELSNWQLDPGVAQEEFASEKAKAATRIKFAHPSNKLPPGVKPQALRKPSTVPATKSAPTKTK
jgi:hypothetical protein